MTKNPASTAPAARFLDHMLRADRIPVRGINDTFEASEPERRAVADALDLVELRFLDFSFRLTPLGKGRFALNGRLRASCAQRCVVTLDPVETTLTEDVSLQFWPRSDVERHERGDDGEAADIDLDGPEPVDDGIIDLGQLAYEVLAAALDPYPRKDDASFEWKDPEAGDIPGDGGAFAALGSLKRDRE